MADHVIYSVRKMTRVASCLAVQEVFRTNRYLFSGKFSSYSCVPNTSAGTLKLFSFVFPPVRALFSTARLLFVQEFSPWHD